MKKYYKIITLAIFCLILGVVSLQANTALAQTSILPACAETGRCTVCDLLQVAVNFGQFLFGIVGALVLLYFFYGGFLWLTSAGASEKIKKGKDILINSIIGLIIVFGAYGGVIFLVNAVTGGGFQWETNLNCAELPAPKSWALPGADQGAKIGNLPTGTTGGGTPSGKSPLGSDCAKADDCDSGACVKTNKSKTICVPKDGTGKEGDTCADTRECSNSCVIGAGNYNAQYPNCIWCDEYAEGGFGETNSNGVGKCKNGPMPQGQSCHGRNIYVIGNKNAPCQGETYDMAKSGNLKCDNILNGQCKE